MGRRMGGVGAGWRWAKEGINQDMCNRVNNLKKEKKKKESFQASIALITPIVLQRVCSIIWYCLTSKGI